MLSWFKKIAGRTDAAEPVAPARPNPKSEGDALLAGGQLDAAAQCYRKAIADVPDQADAYINLGFVLAEQNRHAEAEPILRQAVALDRNSADAFYLLGRACRNQGKTADAAASLERALALKPDFPAVYLELATALRETGQNGRAAAVVESGIERYPDRMDLHYFLGNLNSAAGDLERAAGCFLKVTAALPGLTDGHKSLAVVRHLQGRLEEAVESYGKALALNPGDAEVLHDRSVALQGLNRHEEALAGFESALEIRPDFMEALCNRANALTNLKRYREAVQCYDKALQIQPDHLETLSNRGIALQADGRLEEAIAGYRAALAIKPDFADARVHLGHALLEQKNVGDAFECFQTAAVLAPQSADAQLGIGMALQAQGKLEQASAYYRNAIALDRNLAEAHINLGSVQQLRESPADAVESYQRALAIKPDSTKAHFNLGTALLAQGKLDMAMESFQRATALEPDYAEAYFNLSLVLFKQNKLRQAIEMGHKGLSLRPHHEVLGSLLYMMTFDPQSSPEEYMLLARRYGAEVAACARPCRDWATLGHAVASRGDGPLRVGLVSPDFFSHPVSFFLEGVLAQLNPARIHLVAYVTKAREDELTARIKRHFAAWHSIVGLDDQAAARKIHQDGLHILIDLAGHTGGNRLPVFAWKPAPVQVSWLGYWASTGVREIDYLLADPVSVPDRQKGQFTETVWNLPDSRLCFTPPLVEGELTVAPLPALANGFMTFGSFQTVGKIDDAVLATWARIFHALPSARLRLQSRELNDAAVRENVLRRLSAVGIASTRVTLEGPMARKAYLERHAEVDFILDTFPFPGGTTTCEALYMGVPTLTLAGDTLVSRQGMSLLSAAGLPDWIAGDIDQYVAKALAFAADLNKLAQLRQQLRQQVLASPLFDAARFAGNLDDALHGMWEKKLASMDGQP